MSLGEVGVQGRVGIFVRLQHAGPRLLTVRARNTLLLTGLATLLSWLIAVPLGIWMAGAVRPLERPIVHGKYFASSCVPELVLALALLY